MGLVVIGILNGSITTALTVFIVNLDVSAFGNKVSASLFHKRSCFLVTSICDLWSLRLDIRVCSAPDFTLQTATDISLHNVVL